MGMLQLVNKKSRNPTKKDQHRAEQLSPIITSYLRLAYLITESEYLTSIGKKSMKNYGIIKNTPYSGFSDEDKKYIKQVLAIKVETEEENKSGY